MSNTVKKQHYIWRGYLFRWTDTGDRYKGKVYVLRKRLRGNQEHIEFRELEKIGFEKYYYDMTGFNNKDIIILNQLLSYMQRKELVKFRINSKLFAEATEQRDFIEKRVMCSYEDIDNKWKFLEKLTKKNFSFYEDSKLQKIVNTFQKDIIDAILYQEKKFSENDFLNMIVDFFQNDFNEEDLKYEFNRFFCMQYFRSPRIHDNLKDSINELKKEKEELKDLDTNFYVNMVTVYFAERMALNITYNFSTSILLFENKTDIPFITGDTPIVNLTGTEMNEMTIFHYPISPKIALQLIIVPQLSKMAAVSDNVFMCLEQEFVTAVKTCNQKLADNCVNEIYSNDNSCLDLVKI